MTRQRIQLGAFGLQPVAQESSRGLRFGRGRSTGIREGDLRGAAQLGATIKEVMDEAEDEAVQQALADSPKAYVDYFTKGPDSEAGKALLAKVEAGEVPAEADPRTWTRGRRYAAAEILKTRFRTDLEGWLREDENFLDPETGWARDDLDFEAVGEQLWQEYADLGIFQDEYGAAVAQELRPELIAGFQSKAAAKHAALRQEREDAFLTDSLSEIILSWRVSGAPTEEDLAAFSGAIAEMRSSDGVPHTRQVAFDAGVVAVHQAGRVSAEDALEVLYDLEMVEVGGTPLGQDKAFAEKLLSLRTSYEARAEREADKELLDRSRRLETLETDAFDMARPALVEAVRDPGKTVADAVEEQLQAVGELDIPDDDKAVMRESLLGIQARFEEMEAGRESRQDQELFDGVRRALADGASPEEQAAVVRGAIVDGLVTNVEAAFNLMEEMEARQRISPLTESPLVKREEQALDEFLDGLTAPHLQDAARSEADAFSDFLFDNADEWLAADDGGRTAAQALRERRKDIQARLDQADLEWQEKSQEKRLAIEDSLARFQDASPEIDAAVAEGLLTTEQALALRRTNQDKQRTRDQLVSEFFNQELGATSSALEFFYQDPDFLDAGLADPKARRLAAAKMEAIRVEADQWFSTEAAKGSPDTTMPRFQAFVRARRAEAIEEILATQQPEEGDVAGEAETAGEDARVEALAAGLSTAEAQKRASAARDAVIRAADRELMSPLEHGHKWGTVDADLLPGHARNAINAMWEGRTPPTTVQNVARDYLRSIPQARLDTRDLDRAFTTVGFSQGIDMAAVMDGKLVMHPSEEAVRALRRAGTDWVPLFDSPALKSHVQRKAEAEAAPVEVPITLDDLALYTDPYAMPLLFPGEGTPVQNFKAALGPNGEGAEFYASLFGVDDAQEWVAIQSETLRTFQALND